MDANNEKNLLSYKCSSCYLQSDLICNVKECCNANSNRIHLSGKWITGWTVAPVIMYLIQEGNLVTGSYEFNDGKLIGILTDNVLEGAWVQSDSVGNFRFVFSNDGMRFQGTWGFGKDSISGGDWNGTKVELGKLDVTGTWDTNYNLMNLEQKDSIVVGRYDKNNGRIEGILDGNTLVGTWFESRYKVGSFDTTGRFRFLFNTDNTFTGNRGLNESFTNEGQWNGKRIATVSDTVKLSGTIDVTGTWDTNFKKMYLKQTGFNVSGEYEYNKGRVLGVIIGDTMTGTWYQDINKDGNYETKGKFIFKFSNDGTSFKGTWGYEDSFSNGGLWEGNRIN